MESFTIFFPGCTHKASGAYSFSICSLSQTCTLIVKMWKSWKSTK
nr:MAG TPA: hypothetical protein [Inoviridae sp.]